MLDLILKEGRVAGLVAYELATGEVHVFHSRMVLLATGGFGKVYQDHLQLLRQHRRRGLLAYRAGIPLEDMEFVQFHPTGIYGLGVLISEAAAAKGGYCATAEGERFMERYAPTIKDLAPRDMVSRAIATEIREGRGIERQGLRPPGPHPSRGENGWPRSSRKSLPSSRIYLGIDPARRPIPVQPTCHYMMGGIPTNLDGQVLDADQQPVPGLYAAGRMRLSFLARRQPAGLQFPARSGGFRARAGKNDGPGAEGAAAGTSSPARPKEGCRDRIEKLKSRRRRGKGPGAAKALQKTMTEDCSVFRIEEGLVRGLCRHPDDCKEELRECRHRRPGDALQPGSARGPRTGIPAGLCGSHRRSRRWPGRKAGAPIPARTFPERDDQDWLKHTLIQKTGDGPEDLLQAGHHHPFSTQAEGVLIWRCISRYFVSTPKWTGSPAIRTTSFRRSPKNGFWIVSTGSGGSRTGP